MSFEVGVGAVETVGQSIKQAPAEAYQAPIVASNDQLAQSFESGLMKASEAASASFQAADEARRKTAELAIRDGVAAPAAQVEVRPSDRPTSLGNGVVSYMESFQQRTAAYPSELEDFINKVSDGAKVSGAGGASNGATGVTESDMPSTREVLHIVQRSFQFAIEAELVSNASKHSTQVFSDLMKGQ